MDITRGILRIRNAEPRDAMKLAAWWNDGSVMAHAGFPGGLGTSEERVLRDILEKYDDRRRLLIIEVAGQCVGEMNWRMENEQECDIGIKICEPSYQEKGYGRVLLSMMISHLFDRGVKKIVLDTDLYNLRAQHVYEKLGFEKLRVDEDSWTDQLGCLRSSVHYELVPECFNDFAKVPD